MATPVGSFPAYYCKHSKLVTNNNTLWAPSNFSLWVDMTSAGYGIQTAKGKVVCLNVIANTAYERDLIVTATGSPGPVFPSGNGLFVKLIDNNGTSVFPTPPADQIGAFSTPPPGSSPCPPIAVSTSPVTFGGVRVY